MIYNNNFIKYLEDNLGDAKYVSNNIVVPCPWCDTNPNRTKNHLYISTEVPVFNCFRADCPVGKGTIPKLVRKIEGSDISDKFINDKEFEKLRKNRALESKKSSKHQKFKLPSIRSGQFPSKELYINRRFRFSVDITQIKNLIFDIDGFVNLNKIPINDSFKNIKPLLHDNFVGFISEHHGYVAFRNIDHNNYFSFYKLYLQNTPFTDYFKLDVNPNNNIVVFGEGIFDIYSEYLFDSLGIKDKVRLYASPQSNNLTTLLKSLAFYEQIFRQDIIVLADRGVSLNYFQKLKKFNKHLINSICVYYNKSGKDFNNNTVEPEKFCL